MAAPTTTIWPAAPHTLAKHEILRRYLQAWFPILASHHERLVYFDGFAGPGRYSNGEEGSPVIALKTALEHFAPLQASHLVFVFVERDPARLDWLQNKEIPQLQLPRHIEAHVIGGEFEQILAALLDNLDQKGLQIAPTFAFVDPFGITGLPFALVERLLRRPRCEVLITFMSSSIHRFVEQLPNQVNQLIGRQDASTLISRAQDRGLEARRLYADSLRRVARFVRFFEMRDTSSVPIYDLFFATQHPLGHEKMKDAMWKMDSQGTYTFSDGVDPSQQTLFTANVADNLVPLLFRKFGSCGAVASEAIERYVLDETPYLKQHAKAVLRLLEEDRVPGFGHIEVAPLKQDGARRSRGFARGTMIRFVVGGS